MANTMRHKTGVWNVRAHAGTLAVFLAFALTAAFVSPAAHAQTYTVLYSFRGGADGSDPFAGLILDRVGNLYGTTGYGGIVNSSCTYGCGTVFRVDPTKGKVMVLHSFTGPPSDGQEPLAALVADTAGNVYGTTFYGGAYGKGVVFKLNRGGETLLHSFAGGADGANPWGGLLLDAAGNLYGTTTAGGGTGCGNTGCGTVFKIDNTGTESVLHRFTGGDGSFAQAGLIFDASSNLYGTTEYGGASNYGTVFKLDKTGKFTVLYAFTLFDGAYPRASLYYDRAGDLYGTTYGGGNVGGSDGTLFKLSRSGERVLYDFGINPVEGYAPEAGLISDGAGHLYGTTTGGGELSCLEACGAIYEVDAAGSYTELHSYTGGADGAIPEGGLVRDASGNLYGTTAYGGAHNGAGVVFKLTP
jgi:uncharacterized repeat protein (TIGR03803 family)